MATDFDMVVIGSGPGGYTAAIRAAQLGFRTAIVEKYKVLGGTCTNVGCIPSKAMLDSTENFDIIQHKASKQGIEVGNLNLNFPALVDRNKNVVKQNNDGLNFLMKKNKIQVFTGVGSFVNNTSITVTNEGEAPKTVTSQYFIIATGSKPSTLPGINIDKQRIITSTEALYLKEKPGSMVIIGGGVIGVELASAYHRIGTKVTIIEYADSLIPTMDKELGKELGKLLSKSGIELITGSPVKSAENTGSSVKVTYTDANKAEKEITADYCLVAVGRKSYTAGLALENTKVKLDAKGMVEVNENLQTAEPNIYAIGDVIRGAMLAHKAEDEGIAVVDGLKGHQHKINYLRIPGVVYTWPEVAGVGYTEEQLKAEGIEYRKGKFPFLASGRARASDDTDGFVKVLSDPKYGEILGVHIIGARAADLIASAVIAMEFELTDTELTKISYAHPTFAEALKDAFLISSGKGAINI
ncbi:dihydrolipoyl dehydrogenase [Pseudoflavitalea sp. G-6-1-2]|uniref:dihydrolipoyl dehydrogenase n=1 Tax=Pseudoflavitalea sp. G-6-1-2 TaxID=2728841 RepID=UPI00146A2B03|nr:dihydrolipoyl dehydrogenase [Pseudoflavitalea sp. G-6-1-2]NML20254.1 dihydrolipoyl dehydrogenase [Pseudoflavitalea sp. G-6-1-2]